MFCHLEPEVQGGGAVNQKGFKVLMHSPSSFFLTADKVLMLIVRRRRIELQQSVVSAKRCHVESDRSVHHDRVRMVDGTRLASGWW